MITGGSHHTRGEGSCGFEGIERALLENRQLSCWGGRGRGGGGGGGGGGGFNGKWDRERSNGVTAYIGCF